MYAIMMYDVSMIPRRVCAHSVGTIESVAVRMGQAEAILTDFLKKSAGILDFLFVYE